MSTTTTTRTFQATAASMKNKRRDSRAISIGFGGGDIPILPPVLMCGLWMLATLLYRYVARFSFLPHAYAAGTTALAARVLQFALAIIVSKKIKDLSTQELERANSGIRFTPVHGLATNGEVYSRSRNPLYLILLWIMVSLAVLVNSVWFLAATAIMWTYLQFWVIPVEERYLQKRFGKEYHEYCRRTSRWIGVSSEEFSERIAEKRL